MQQDQEQPLPVERVGAVLATLQHYGRAHSAEALARLGVDEATWEASLAAAAGLVASEERPAGPAGTAFTDSFCETAARLRAEQPPLSALGPLPAEDSGESLDDPTQQPTAALDVPAAPPEALGPMGTQPEDRWRAFAVTIHDEGTTDGAVVRPALPFVIVPRAADEAQGGATEEVKPVGQGRVSHFESDDETRLGTVADLGQVIR